MCALSGGMTLTGSKCGRKLFVHAWYALVACAYGVGVWVWCGCVPVVLVGACYVGACVVCMCACGVGALPPSHSPSAYGAPI